MANQKEKLFSNFPPVSTKTWMESVTADLKGADFEKRLVWKTNEGFNVNPFYRSEDIKELKTTESLPGEFPYVRGTEKTNNWYTRQNIIVEDFKAANAKALDVLTKGINSLGFKIDRDAVSLDNITVLLKGINPEAVELNFETCNQKSIELAKVLVEYYQLAKVNVMECYGSINYDPLKPLLKKGTECDQWADQAAEMVKTSAPLPRFRTLSVNAHKLSDGGSYIFQELGYALANGNEILSKLVAKGLDVSLVAKKIKFNFGVGGNYFMEIAKFRASRWLWASIVDAYNPPCDKECPNNTDKICRCACKINVHAQTSTFNKTIYDAHVNLLRTQTEAMSASLAGVNSMTVNPFDITYKSSDIFSERIARNQQLLLKEECHFDKVTDPSSGSYYIETLTASIAEQAWKLFLEIDEKGYYEALKAGTVQKAVQNSADARAKALATRREILLGTNQYPNFNELAANKINEEAACGCGCSSHAGGKYATLPTKRLATPYEELRLATEKSGKRPKVFMLTIGNLNMRLARAQFASNFFACAGYEVIDNLGFETVEEGIKAARNKNADIIVICSSDDEYATFAPEAHKFTEKGKEHFVVAGAPACMEDLKAQGIEHFINVKSNVLETLRIFNAKLGIQ